MANNKLKTEELDKVLDSVSSEEQLQEYLDRYTNKDGYGFCQYFNEYLAEHDIVHAQVIADCNLDKDYATQITNGTKRNPGRDKALALCIAAGMKKDEINRAMKLLKVSPLYSRNKRDSVLLMHINKGIRKVIYINLELDRASCLHRFKDVYEALHLPPRNLANIDIWNLRGASVPMDKLAPRLIRRAAKKGYLAVVLDPIYKVITGDENSADQMAKFCNQFDLVCRELDCAVIYCHHHSKGAQGGKRSMDRASGSGVFARDPDAMLDMTELVPTDAIREQLHNKAACAAAKDLLDARGHADAYDPDDALSRSRMLAIAREHLPLPDLHRLDADTAAAIKRADAMTAWRIEGTLREFARFDPVNLWFDYPVHKLDSGLLEDLQPESDYKQLGSRGAAKRWGDKDTAAKSKRAELRTAFEACTMDGKVTIYSMAEYLNLKPDTVRRRLKSDGGFWIDGTSVGLKEPGSNG